MSSPGFIGREWIETYSIMPVPLKTSVLPALLVGSGLKPCLVELSAVGYWFLPALLVGSGLKRPVAVPILGLRFLPALLVGSGLKHHAIG